MQYDHPSTDFTRFSLSVVDPAHSNDASTFNASLVGLPPPGTATYGPTDTFHTSLPLDAKDPAITSSSYPLEFTFSDNRDPQAVPSHVDLMYTITVDDTPYRGFYFNYLSIGRSSISTFC